MREKNCSSQAITRSGAGRRGARFALALGIGLLGSLLLAPVSQARDVPVYFTYTGTVLDTAIDINHDGNPANVVYGQSRGSFGASMTTIVTEFAVAEGTCDSPSAVYLSVVHSTAIITFANDDQAYTVIDSGWMCLDFADGNYTGAVNGRFDGGTGRFENASGDFVSKFDGRNLTLLTLGFGFGSIQGTTSGTIDLH